MAKMTAEEIGNYAKKKQQAQDKSDSYQSKISNLESEIAATTDEDEKKKLEKKLESTKTKYEQFQESNKEYLASNDEDNYDIDLDSAFLIEYSRFSDGNYYDKLQEGLRIRDMRGVLGLPMQFLPNTDFRIDGSSDNTAFGRVYSERIIKNIPLLLITPGVPSFMSSFSKKDKKIALANIFNGMAEATFDKLMKNGSGKYYSLKYDYVSYFAYVNTMVRAAAIILGIDKVTVDGKELGSKNWLYNTSDGKSSLNIFSHGQMSRFLGPYTGCIAFYADCGSTVSDSFSNSTGQSSLSSTINGLSDQAREMNFLAGTIGSTVGATLDKFTGQGDLEKNMQNVQDAVKRVGLGGNNMLTGIINKAQTLLAGGKLIFPEIWTDSNFGRSYSASMKLVAPAGDKLSVFLYILVPIYHLIALTLPRESISQAYYSPFLVRCYYKGLFNVDMGIITDLSVNKGAEGEWTVDGIPTVAEVSFGIKDMYEGMAMTKGVSTKGKFGLALFSNITELDYIANSCGVNINDQDIQRMAKLYFTLQKGNLQDAVTSGIFGSIVQSLNNKVAKVFGVF